MDQIFNFRVGAHAKIWLPLSCPCTHIQVINVSLFKTKRIMYDIRFFLFNKASTVVNLDIQSNILIHWMIIRSLHQTLLRLFNWRFCNSKTNYETYCHFESFKISVQMIQQAVLCLMLKLDFTQRMF